MHGIRTGAGRRLVLSLSVGWLWIAACAARAENDFTFLRFAGSDGGSGFVDGTGAEARFSAPYGIARDILGDIYVADTYNHAIRMITPGGEVKTLAGGNYSSQDGDPATTGFRFPYAVAVDRKGTVYVADSVNGLIRKVAPEGVVTTLAGSPTNAYANFTSPEGVAVDSAGNVYVADTMNHAIRKVTSNGSVSTLAGKVGNSGSNDGQGSAARFNVPQGIAVDGAGNLFVADTGNCTIRKITPSGNVLTVAGQPLDSGWADGVGADARFALPAGLAVDGVGNVFIADMYNSVVRMMTPDGTVTTLAGQPGWPGSADGPAAEAFFFAPEGVAVDDTGTVYVADGSTIRRLTPDGMVTTWAGGTFSRGAADGVGSNAQFNQPGGLTLDDAANLYVADTRNSTIRKITPDGTVTTLAGWALNRGSADGIGGDARFFWPNSLTIDSGGNLCVADTGNSTIRRVTANGAVTTLAGLAGQTGTADGGGAEARFNRPSDVAADAAGNLYVADTGNATIRKITSAGIVTTLAGQPGVAGSTDGVGTNASFGGPQGLAVDPSGVIYVADPSTIRKVTPAGVVTTLAGQPKSIGSRDGQGAVAQFNRPQGLAVSSAGDLYVADTGNYTIRRVTPAGLVTTVGGLAGAFTWGNVEGTGSAARFSSPQGLCFDKAGNLYVADTGNCAIRRGIPACPDRPVIDASLGQIGVARQLDISSLSATRWQWSLVRRPAASQAQLSSPTVRNPTFTPDIADLYVFELRATNAAGQIALRQVSLTISRAPIITVQPGNLSVLAGTNVLFLASVRTQSPLSLQWFKDSVAIAGATNFTLALTNVHRHDSGEYTVQVANALGRALSSPANLVVRAPQRLNPPQVLAVGAVQFTFGDADGSPMTIGDAVNLQVQASTDLVNWLPLTNAVLPGNRVLLLRDSAAPRYPKRFFRVMEQ